MITRAVILAAGRGTRLGAITANYPKALLDVAGRPVVVRILDGLAAAGIDDVCIVTGHFASLVESELGNGGESGLRLSYVRQERLEGTARALALARGFAGSEKFVFALGDILVRPGNYRRVIKAAALATAVVAVNEVDDPSAGAAVYLDPGDPALVTRIVEKPPPGTSTTRWNNAGFGVLGPEIWPAIDALKPSARGEYEFTDAIAALVDSGERVVAVPVEGPWFDVGTPGDLERARAEFARR